MSAPESLPPQPHGHEAYSAVANALKLAGSMVVTFGITIAVRQFFIPRQLGTELYGQLNYADGFAGLFLVASWLGVDTWIRKELGVTLKTADGLYGGVVAMRLMFTVVLTAAMVLALKLLGRSNEIVLMACIFGVGQVMVMIQNTASALLHAAGKVGGLSIANIITKVLWALFVLPVVIFGLPIIWLAVAFTASETVKATVTTLLARHHTGLKLNVDLKLAWHAMRQSLPFWVNNIALAGTGRADVAVLGTLAATQLGSVEAANREVGWYTLVLGIGGMLMVLTPVISWVLLPLLSRALLRGREEAAVIIRRALEATVVLGAPLSVGGFVAADELILLYKPEYAPSALVLKVMAVTFLLTYLNIVTANCLAALGRGWWVTLTSISTLLLTPAIDFFLVPAMITRLGPGGGAVACGTAIVVAEVVTTAVMLRNLGRLAFDARLLSIVVRTLITGAGVIALDFFLKTTGLNPWLRIGVDAVMYVVLALGSRSVRVADIRAFISLAKAQRAARGAAPA